MLTFSSVFLSVLPMPASEIPFRESMVADIESLPKGRIALHETDRQKETVMEIHTNDLEQDTYVFSRFRNLQQPTLYIPESNGPKKHQTPVTTILDWQRPLELWASQAN